MEIIKLINKIIKLKNKWLNKKITNKLIPINKRINYVYKNKMKLMKINIQINNQEDLILISKM